MEREGSIRIPSGCAIAAVISREGKRMTGEKIVRAMKRALRAAQGGAEGGAQ